MSGVCPSAWSCNGGAGPRHGPRVQRADRWLQTTLASQRSHAPHGHVLQCGGAERRDGQRAKLMRDVQPAPSPGEEKPEEPAPPSPNVEPNVEPNASPYEPCERGRGEAATRCSGGGGGGHRAASQKVPNVLRRARGGCTFSRTSSRVQTSAAWPLRVPTCPPRCSREERRHAVGSRCGLSLAVTSSSVRRRARASLEHGLRAHDRQ
jgi:hypothetical protein